MRRFIVAAVIGAMLATGSGVAFGATSSKSLPGSSTAYANLNVIDRGFLTVLTKQWQPLAETYATGSWQYDVTARVTSASGSGPGAASCSTVTATQNNVASGVKIGVSCYVKPVAIGETVTANSYHTAKNRLVQPNVIVSLNVSATN